MTEVRGPIIGTMLLAGINPAGQPEYIDGTVLVAGLNASGQMEYLDPDNIGSGGGAPTGAQYVVGAADSSLSAELVLGTAVIMAGTLAARPAASLAGLLYFATDALALYRDTGAAWVKLSTKQSSTMIQRTAGGLTTASGGFAELSSALRLTLPAIAGDLLEVGINGLVSPGATSAHVFDAATVVGGSVLNRFSVGTNGHVGWYCTTNVTHISGSAWYTAVAGDVSSGNITVTLVSNRQAGANDGTVNADATNAFSMFYKNHGQA